MSPIEWTEDGPMGEEEIVFTGLRLSIIDKKGRIKFEDSRDLESFGGVLPAVGDFVSTLWQSDDPEPNEHYRVVERHYIGEFAGDNCWWLLLQPEPPSSRALQIFKIARTSSAERRERQVASMELAKKSALKSAADLKLKARTKRRAQIRAEKGPKRL